MPYEVPRSPILADFVLCMPPKSRLERCSNPFSDSFSRLDFIQSSRVAKRFG
jgi:hypothetical protein